MGGNNTLGDVLLGELKSGSQNILEGTAAVPSRICEMSHCHP